MKPLRKGRTWFVSGKEMDGSGGVFRMGLTNIWLFQGVCCLNDPLSDMRRIIKRVEILRTQRSQKIKLSVTNIVSSRSMAHQFLDKAQ
ncbi:hypothetical protein GGR01_001326 [Acetobacter oeni]|nr:hypothetical protein [Acetobacter oeni]